VNEDCDGNQCCTLAPEGVRKCELGRCAGTAGGALCGCAIAAIGSVQVDNNTLDAQGSNLGRSRSLFGAVVAMLLCAVWLRRRQLQAVRVRNP
jgi:hypothetical protein